MRMSEKSILTQSTQSLKSLRLLFNIFVLFPTPCPTGGVGGGVAGLFIQDQILSSPRKKEFNTKDTTKENYPNLILK
jgi:hypothetical protein